MHPEARTERGRLPPCSPEYGRHKNEAGGTAGVTPRSIELVCTEKDLVCENTPNEENGQKKKQDINQIARERYIVVVGFSSLDNRHHLGFKLDVKNTYVKSNEDVLPVSLTHLLKQVQACEEPSARHKALVVDPAELAILRAKNSSGPQLVTVGGPDNEAQASQ